MAATAATPAAASAVGTTATPDEWGWIAASVEAPLTRAAGAGGSPGCGAAAAGSGSATGGNSGSFVGSDSGAVAKPWSR
ncbi:MAG TPA: hypothetical protein VFV02_14125, partial [Acidimicrobiales bacterium]|nr:hypothetical protein [Acidimicrobiales bacterium]